MDCESLGTILVGLEPFNVAMVEVVKEHKFGA